MNPHVKKVAAKLDYKLQLTFTDWKVKVFDAKPFLNMGIFLDLRDESLFKSARVWHGTVQWSGGQDICPDTLYEDSIPVPKRTRMMVKQKKNRYKSKKPKAK
jgi:hypothetical protein